MSDQADFSWWEFLLEFIVMFIVIGYIKTIILEFRRRSSVKEAADYNVIELPPEEPCQSDIEFRFDALIKNFESKAINYYVYVVASRLGLLGEVEDCLEPDYPREFSRPYIDYRSVFTLDETSAFMPFVRKRLETLPESANASTDERSRFEQYLLEQAEREAERIVTEYANR